MATADLSALIAVYQTPGGPPEVTSVTAGDQATLVKDLDEAVQILLGGRPSRVPAPAIREVIDNVVHAGCADTVVTILDGGRTVLVSDRGPGIPDKIAALLPGFTTAGAEERAVIRGVGAGLAIAQQALASAGGSLEITDNLVGGTVVRLHVPPPPEPAMDASSATMRSALTERQLRALLLILELGPVGPTRLARELAVAPSTAYRDLMVLQDAGLVTVDSEGRREVSAPGLSYVQSVL